MRKPLQNRRISVADYLELEEMQSPIRHEYVYGFVHAMSGASTRHNRIARNVTFLLQPIERTSDCRVFLIDVKVQAARDVIYYPDVVVACGAAAQVEYIIEEPLFVVEVTSPSTKATDRREKLAAYCAIRSLRGYLIVDHRRRHAVMYSRSAEGEWFSREVADAEEVVEIPALDTRLALSEIYEGVVLPPLTVGEEDEEPEELL